MKFFKIIKLINFIIFIVSIIKKFFTILLLVINNNKSLNLYKNSYITKFFLYFKTLFKKWSFLKRYFIFWSYFRTVLKIALYFNVILSVYIIYMFTDFDHTSFINFFDKLGLYGFLTSSLAGLYLYNDNIIINFFKRIFSFVIDKIPKFEWLERIRSGILKKIYEIKNPIPEDKPIPRPGGKYNPKYNPADSINPPSDFNYRKYLLIGASIITIGTLTYYFWDSERVSDAWYWITDITSTYYVRWGFLRLYWRLSDPFYSIYRKISRLWRGGNPGPDPGSNVINDLTGIVFNSDSEDISLNDNRKSTLFSGFGDSMWRRKPGDLIDMPEEDRSLFPHPDSTNNSPVNTSSDQPIPSLQKPISPDSTPKATNVNLPESSTSSSSSSGSSSDPTNPTWPDSPNSSSSSSQPTSPILPDSPTSSNSSTPKASSSQLPPLNKGKGLTDEAAKWWSKTDVD